jgi:hypothetical protein
MFDSGGSGEWAVPGGVHAAPAPAAPSPDVQALVAAIDALAEQQPDDLPGPQALLDAAALLAQRERLNVLALRRISDVDARGLHSLDGAPTTSSWVAGQQSSLRREDITFARRLAGLPTLDEAVRDGILSVQTAARVSTALSTLRRHVDRPDGLVDGQDGEQALWGVIVDGVRSQVVQSHGGGLADDDPRVTALTDQLVEVAERDAGQLARLEAAFVLLAREVEPALLPAALGMLVDALLPNELERRAADGEQDRGVTLARKPDGSGWKITQGDLDLECGELLSTVLKAQLAVDPDNPTDTASYEQLRADGWQPGDALPSNGPRSLRQRRHDALRSGLRALLDSGALGLRDKVAPHIGVTIGLDALHGAPGALPGVTASGARVPLSLVRRWWCDSAVTRFVVGLGNRVLEMSHTERTLKAHERRAKHVETGGRCQGAGCCTGGHARLVPHHPEAFAVCGTTSYRDTVMLCEQTHHDVHHGRTVRLRDGRLLSAEGWVTGPD